MEREWYEKQPRKKARLLGAWHSPCVMTGRVVHRHLAPFHSAAIGRGGHCTRLVGTAAVSPSRDALALGVALSLSPPLGGLEVC